MAHFLTILEVSQKQAYIFSSNSLKDNVTNSAVIAWVMSPKYFSDTVNQKEIFDEEKNIVYSGGGHVVLEFENEETARTFVKIVTFQIRSEYPGIEVFSVTREYDQQKLDKEPGKCLKDLTANLERKKSVRLASFHQGTFGIEEIDSKTLDPKLVGNYKNDEMPKQEREIEKKLSPDEKKQVDEFRKLGGSKDKSNFIAVVHIDGNAMGKRVENIYKNSSLSWNEFKKHLQEFSKTIDDDFKAAYKEMTNEVESNLKSGTLKELKLNDNDFPGRRIITAGDDICFVAEGRIGIECAVSFIKALTKKKNKVDKTGYAACAGVAIVHQKYPFYRAYELAESLCSNAKRFGAKWSSDGSGSDISAIDWHIEFGEMGDSLDEIRQQYQTPDGRLEMRPYIVTVTEEEPEKEKQNGWNSILEKEPVRQYSNFKKLVNRVQNNEIIYARGKMKELRNALKQGERTAESFVYFNKMEDVMLENLQENTYHCDQIASGEGLERKLFIKIKEGKNDSTDGEKHSVIFDALEICDTYIGFKEERQ